MCLLTSVAHAESQGAVHSREWVDLLISGLGFRNLRGFQRLEWVVPVHPTKVASVFSMTLRGSHGLGNSQPQP